jgi:aryl-alcohol dehydrogenase-like predicted oxidoreductase
MHVTRVGFGAWAIGGGGWSYAWGAQDDDSSIAAIRLAVNRGINWIDTAAVYGLGHSAEIVARALADVPAASRPYIFTKGGLEWDPAHPARPPRRVATAASIRREIDASLRRLRVERIDLYQVHWPPEADTPIEEYWQAMLDLKREGKARAVGLSNHSMSQLETAERLGHVDSLQPPFSAIRREAAADELPWCAAHGTGVIVYSPMQAGLLSGGFSRDRARRLPPDDWRARDPQFTGEPLERNLALAAALEPIAKRRGVSVASVAIAWTLAWPGVTAAIVGARSAAQVDGWLDAGSVDLTPADLETIGYAIDRTGAGAGPARPRG